MYFSPSFPQRVTNYIVIVQYKNQDTDVGMLTRLQTLFSFYHFNLHSCVYV